MIEILSGKSKKNGTVEITFSEGSKKHSDVEFKDARPHPDLVNAMRALRIHAAILADYNPNIEMDKKVKDKPVFFDEEEKEKFTVSGITVSEKGIILTAQRITKSGKSVNFNTPLVNTSDEYENGYEYLEDLSNCVAADPQGDLFQPEVVNKIQIAEDLTKKETEGKKLPVGKKVAQSQQHPAGVVE